MVFLQRDMLSQQSTDSDSHANSQSDDAMRQRPTGEATTSSSSVKDKGRSAHISILCVDSCGIVRDRYRRVVWVKIDIAMVDLEPCLVGNAITTTQSCWVVDTGHVMKARG
jgi:hypothetical protein